MLFTSPVTVTVTALKGIPPPHPSAFTSACAPGAHPSADMAQLQRQLTYLNEQLCSFTAFLERKEIL